MNKMAAAIIFTSQGIPFFQAGEELLRTKPGFEVGELYDRNSFKSSDEVNSIKCDDKTKNYDVFRYYKGLIEFRKNEDEEWKIVPVSTGEVTLTAKYGNVLPVQ